MMTFGSIPSIAPKSTAAGEHLRCRCRDRVRAVEILDDFLKHDGEAEGHQDLIRMRTLVEILDQAALHEEPDQRHDRYREQDRKRAPTSR